MHMGKKNKTKNRIIKERQRSKEFESNNKKKKSAQDRKHQHSAY